MKRIDDDEFGLCHFRYLTEFNWRQNDDFIMN